MKVLYSLLTLLLLTGSAQTAIVYTDVVPDLVTVPSSTASFDLDMDNNSSADFPFTYVDVSGMRFIIVQVVAIGTSNLILEDTSGGNHYARALTLNAPIAPTSVFWHCMAATNPRMLTEFMGMHAGLSKVPEKLNKLKKLKTLVLIVNDFSEEEKKRIKAALPNCDVRF